MSRPLGNVKDGFQWNSYRSWKIPEKSPNNLLLQMILDGKLYPEKLIGKRISLEQAVIDLPAMDSFHDSGLTLVDRF